jgi:hypothetical protein
MKTLRRILIVLAAPAGILFGLSQLGGTPLYKGFNTGFTAIAMSQGRQLSLSTESGDLTCWVKLRLPSSAQPVSARLSNSLPLAVYQESIGGTDQWLAVVADGQKREEKFKWPSGTSVVLTFGNDSNLALKDWRVYLSDQGFDSKDRALWRRTAFIVTIGCLLLAIVGAVLEARDKLKDDSVAFTHERCLEQLIKSVEGTTPKETTQLQSILTKVLLQRISAMDAIAPLALKQYQKHQLWFRARDQFSRRLEWLIVELTNDRNYLMTL